MTSGGAVFNVSELVALDQDLGKVTGLMTKAVTAAMVESGNGLRDTWRSNIQETSPQGHLKNLDDAVTAEMKFSIGSIGVTVGPEVNSQVGSSGKGDEYGSAHTPAHMSGHRATDMILPRHERSIDAALVYAMKPVTGG